jgi:hypothetical protein
MSIRDFLKSKPWAGWAVAGVLIVVTGWVWYRSLGGGADPYTLGRMTETITIRDRETGDEWTMQRGRFEQALWDRPLPIDPSQGVANPKTGKLTGFPKSEWESTIDRISRERNATASAKGSKPSTTAPGK